MEGLIITTSKAVGELQGDSKKVAREGWPGTFLPSGGDSVQCFSLLISTAIAQELQKLAVRGEIRCLAKQRCCEAQL